MIEQRIATRYAKSLINLGVETEVLETLNTDISVVKEALENRDLYLLVKSPIIKADKKIAIFKEIFGSSFNKVTMMFLELITKKGREIYLPEIATAFFEQYKKLKHVTAVKLITASPMSEEVLARIKSTLLDSTSTDQNVELETEVDPELIGGFVIQMDDKLYDASVVYKLEQIKQKFTSNKYIKSI